MGHVDVAGVRYELPDGRVLLDDVSFRVGEGAKVALVGANGAGKTTLLRIITGDLTPHAGVVTRSGGLGVMRQSVGAALGEAPTVADLLLSVAPPRIRAAAYDVDACERTLMDTDDEKTQMAYAHALSEYADAGGYDLEVTWDVCTMAALGLPFDRAKYRELATLSGGEQKRLVLEYLLRGPDEVLLLDEPDNFLDVPGKIWLEGRIRESAKTVLMISHDRELLNNTATRVVTVELGGGSGGSTGAGAPRVSGNTVWTHPGGFGSYHQARQDRFARFEELRRRWDEEHAKLKQLVLHYKIKAEYNDGMASQYRAAQTRLRKFEEAGPPTEQPREQQVSMRLTGGRTGKRAVVCEHLELTGLMKPFDLEVWYGERVAVLGSNGSGKSHFLRLLAAGGTRPDKEHEPVGDVHVEPVRHRGIAKLGARVRPGWFVQTHDHPELVGRTLLEILHRGDATPDGRGRAGMGREQASRVLDRYELSPAAEQRFESLSGGQQARFQILLLELSGATLLLLDEPTDNLDVQSAEALEEGLAAFEGTVLAVTHDRWFARGFDRFLVYGADGRVYESDGPVWDEGRVERVR
ncbi:MULTISPECIES: ATP-binding cassette domain-containing protein [unclassified Nocardioides]|uniref:ABC-F family ATP-binding cassette domain-containing protein n=1 Tax=unclassified Nocardioides TaxID=2615069 RepID=UPI000322C5E5|nr:MULTISPECIES: ATP-binding cassette domain-containing protein [unclassified Nocardioides]